MANIYELTAQMLHLQEMLLQADEESEEEIAEMLVTAEEDIEEKAVGYAHIIKNVEADIQGLKAEEQRLADRRRKAEKAVTRLKDTLQEAMLRTGKTSFEKGNFSFRVARNGGSLPIVLDVPAEELPDDLVKVKKEPDKGKIAEYIEATGDLSYAHYGERGSSLRIR